MTTATTFTQGMDLEATVRLILDQGLVSGNVAGLLDDGLHDSGGPLDRIAELMSGTEWNADTLDAIAAIVRRAGRTIADLDTFEPVTDTYKSDLERFSGDGTSEASKAIQELERGRRYGPLVKWDPLAGLLSLSEATAEELLKACSDADGGRLQDDEADDKAYEDYLVAAAFRDGVLAAIQRLHTTTTYSAIDGSQADSR